MLVSIKYLYCFSPKKKIKQRKNSISLLISYKNYLKQKNFDYRVSNLLCRSGLRLKMYLCIKKWWIFFYRFNYFKKINYYKELTFEEYSKLYTNKLQYIHFLQNNAQCYELSTFINFRLTTLVSLFQLKYQTGPFGAERTVRYIKKNYRINYILQLFMLQLRANHLVLKKFNKTFHETIPDFIELDETEQEIYDIKLSTYRKFIF